MAVAQLPPPGEGLRDEDRLRRRRDFLRCYRQGRRLHGTFAVLHFHPNDLARARLGITASRKVGNAVSRHRMKRRVREVFRRWPSRSRLAGWDLVVHLRAGSGRKDSGFDAFRSDLEGLFERLSERGS